MSILLHTIDRAYGALKPLIFKLDPEAIHEKTIHSLELASSLGFLEKLFPKPVVDPVEILGVKFPNRVGLAAGMDKQAKCVDAFTSMGFGFVEVGTLTPRPQSGNPQPRLFRIPENEAIINRMGFNNCGIDRGVKNIKRSTNSVVGINLGKNATTPQEKASEDYRIGIKVAWEYADYLAINISSPNTKGLRDLQTGDAYVSLLNEIIEEAKIQQDRTNLKVPILVKFAPDLKKSEIQKMASIAQRQGIDGIIATNTTLSREGVSEEHPSKSEAGGLSGAPVRDMSTQAIQSIRKEVGGSYPIIGVGGITTGDHAVEKIQAGADLIQIYTGLIYQGPSLVSECAKALKLLGD